MPQQAVESLPSVEGVTDATTCEEGLRVRCRESRAKAKAINYVEDAGATVTDIQVEDHSLEDIFAALTGEEEPGEETEISEAGAVQEVEA